MDARTKAFTAEATQRFKFLVDLERFEGPDTTEAEYVGYTSGPWQIWVVLEEHDKTVDTFIWYDNGGRVLRAPLRRVAAESKLKGLGQPSISAQTAKGMQKSLASQADMLKRIIPLLRDAESGPSLMELAVQ